MMADLGMAHVLFVACGIPVFICAFVLMGKPTRKSMRARKSQHVEKTLTATLDVFVHHMPYVDEVVRERKRERLRTACLQQMPHVLDVVTLGLSAGLSFDTSLDLYCENYSTEMSELFREALLTWRLGSKTRAETLEGLAKDLDVAAFSSFSSAVLQALEFGAPLAQALKGQANTIRDVQKSAIEEHIEKVPVKMLVPLGTLIVPAMLLSIVGPLLAGSVVGS